VHKGIGTEKGKHARTRGVGGVGGGFLGQVFKKIPSSKEKRELVRLNNLRAPIEGKKGHGKKT